MNQEILQEENIVKLIYDSYRSYAAYVILNRAIPRFEDGLLSVQRKILYHMLNAKIYSFVKSGRVCGMVSGLYYPHGEASLYSSLVKMAAPHLNKVRFIETQGNFGSVDREDPPASQRYTEVKLSLLSRYNFDEIGTGNIEYIPNYDGSTVEPRYLTSKLPIFLLSSICGIAVGISSNIPPHCINEVIDALVALIKNPESDPTDYIIGPEFSIPCYVTNKDEIKSIYKKGNGSFKLRGKYEIKNNTIFIYSFPYNSDKSKFFEELKKLVEDEIIDIKALRDKTTIRTLIEIDTEKPEYTIQILLNKTCLTSFAPLNMNLLVGGAVKLLSLKESLVLFLENRVRITQNKLKNNIENLEDSIFKVISQLYLYDNNDVIIEFVKTNKINELKEFFKNNPFNIDNFEIKNKNFYKENYLNYFSNSKYSVRILENILNLYIKQLGIKSISVALKRLDVLLEEIKNYQLIINSKDKFNDFMIKEFLYMKNKNTRETLIINEKTRNTAYDTYEIINLLTDKGFLITIKPENIKIQKRGGTGKNYIQKQENVISAINCKSTSKIVFYSNKGKIYIDNNQNMNKKFFNINSHFQFEKDEKITKIFYLNDSNFHTAIISKDGRLRVVETSKILNRRVSGSKLSDFDDISYMIDFDIKTTKYFAITNGTKIICCSADHFPLRNSKKSKGVIAIRNQTSEECIILPLTGEEDIINCITQSGLIKNFKFSDLRNQKRGGKGTLISKKESNDRVIAIKSNLKEGIKIITREGFIIYMNANNIRTTSKASKGVKAIELKDSKIVNVV